MRRLTAFALLLCVVLLSACAQTGQSLRLSPEPPATGPAVGPASEIGLRVIDAREQVAGLGTQQTLRGEVLPLSATQDIAYIVQLAAAEALQGYNLTAALWTSQREPRLEITIDTLNHEVRAGVPWQLDTEVALRAVVWAHGERLTTRAQSTLNNQRATPPGAEANAAVIEEAITRALSQVLSQDLAHFIAEEP